MIYSMILLFSKIKYIYQKRRKDDEKDCATRPVPRIYFHPHRLFPNANVSNQTDTNSSSSDTPADNTGSANTPKKIAMIMGQMNMDFFVYIAAGAEKAADELGVDLTVWNAASDIVKVGELVDLAAEQGFDAIITPDSTGSAKSAIEAAAGLGIPVVGYDSLAFPRTL